MLNAILINLQPIFIITAFKERPPVPTTTERSEIRKCYFIEHFYSEIHVEFSSGMMIVAADAHTFEIQEKSRGVSLWKHF